MSPVAAQPGVAVGRRRRVAALPLASAAERRYVGRTGLPASRCQSLSRGATVRLMTDGHAAAYARSRAEFRDTAADSFAAIHPDAVSLVSAANELVAGLCLFVSGKFP